MTAPQKRIAIVFGLIVPYVFFVFFMILSTAGHSDKLPAWVPFAGAGYLLLAIFLGVVLSRRIKGDEPPRDPERAQVSMNWARSYGTRLVVLWSGLFVYGAYRTVKGDFPLERAIPAGLLLLGFIAVFGWSVFRIKKAQATQPKYPR